MNREILFRGKRVDNGEWSYGYYANCQSPGYKPHITGHYIIEYPGTYHEIYTSTVGQYTGLKDRNGKRIFEGDVVKYNGTKHEVSFEHMGGTAYFGIRFPDREESWAFGHYADPFLISVIGNIHDNPELIGGNNEQA